jgi:hypothetical protein
MNGNSQAPRLLSKEFFEALRDRDGLLHPVLALVHADSTLDLQLRRESINVYYRGGSLLKIDRKQGQFMPSFAAGYTKKYMAFCARNDLKPFDPGLPLPVFRTRSQIERWIQDVPHFKQMMDLHGPGEEREIQQRVVWVNNRSRVANGTDWYICDTEHSVPVDRKDKTRRVALRVDMLALNWPSQAAVRKGTSKPLDWALIEIKNGLAALGGASGLEAHLEEMLTMLQNPGWVDSRKQELWQAFNQRRDLGLIAKIERGLHEDSLADAPKIVFLLANCDPASDQLRNWLKHIDGTLPAAARDRVRIFQASLMGYAMYDDAGGLLTVAEALKRLGGAAPRRG